MDTKLPLIMLLLGFAGCQPKSDIDKCVDAKIVETCAKYFGVSNQPEKENMNGHDTTQKPVSCEDWFTRGMGGEIRMECLKAQAGEK
jgi:hypothetical protein